MQRAVFFAFALVHLVPRLAQADGRYDQRRINFYQSLSSASYSLVNQERRNYQPLEKLSRVDAMIVKKMQAAQALTKQEGDPAYDAARATVAEVGRIEAHRYSSRLVANARADYKRALGHYRSAKMGRLGGIRRVEAVEFRPAVEHANDKLKAAMRLQRVLLKLK